MTSSNVLDPLVITNILTSLENELRPDWTPPDASPEYRKRLAVGLLYRSVLANAPKVGETLKSGALPLTRGLSSGVQTFDTVEKVKLFSCRLIDRLIIFDLFPSELSLNATGHESGGTASDFW